MAVELFQANALLLMQYTEFPNIEIVTYQKNIHRLDILWGSKLSVISQYPKMDTSSKCVNYTTFNRSCIRLYRSNRSTFTPTVTKTKQFEIIYQIHG